MVFEIGQYKLDIDVVKTKYFYKNADVVSKSCSCDGCLNFEKAISELPTTVITFFTNLGIDMRKVCECYVNDADDNGDLLYGDFYHVCGTLLEGKSAWRKINKSFLHWDSKSGISISSDFCVSFQKDTALFRRRISTSCDPTGFFCKNPLGTEKKKSLSIMLNPSFKNSESKIL
mgnify:CR=1 FL=1